MIKTKIRDDKICFSFEYFDSSDTEVCPPTFGPHYTQTLMERLKAICAFTVNDFVSNKSKSLRAHSHAWEATSRPRGFQHLNEQLRSSQGWQFQLSKDEHGRVHGFFINNTFYVIWLDRDHKVYS